MTTPSSPPLPRARAPRRRLGPAVQLVVLVVLIAFVGRFVDAEQVKLAFAGVSAGELLAFVVLMLGVRLMAAWRWLVVARGHLGLPGLTLAFLARVELLADFANVWVQSIVGGEAVRVWKVARRTGERRRGPASVVVDRAVGTVGLLVACLPFAVVLALELPPRLPEGVSGKLWLLAGAVAVTLAAAVLAWRYAASFRDLARRTLDFAKGSRFMTGPLLISVASYPVIVAAHYLGVSALAERGLLVTAMVALLPQLGRAVPLSVFGVTAVEGSVFAVGRLLGIETETLLLVVALNLTARYLGAIAGAVAEAAQSGGRFFRDIVRADLADDEGIPK